MEREPEGQSQQQATSVCLVKTRRVEEDAGVQDDRLPILNLDRPGWRRATHTCNSVYQIENKIKFFMAEALRGVDSLIFDARLNRNRYHNANQADCKDPTGAALEQRCDFDLPVVAQRQAPTVQTVAIPQTQFIDRAMNVPLVTQR